MKRFSRILRLTVAVLVVALAAPAMALGSPPHLRELQEKARELAVAHPARALPVGIEEVVGNRFSLTLYDPDTQKSFLTDKICFFGESGDTTGTWVSSKNPDKGGLWVQAGHEIWVFGANLFNLEFQISLMGRYLSTKEITGTFSILDFNEPSSYGAFKLKRTSYGICSDLE